MFLEVTVHIGCKVKGLGFRHLIIFGTSKKTTGSGLESPVARISHFELRKGTSAHGITGMPQHMKMGRFTLDLKTLQT